MNLTSTQLKTVVAVVFFKIIILTFLPLTGDEAYFIKWAMHPSLGYYDHPPMIGWVIYLMSFVSENYVFYRYFSLLTTMLIALVIYKIARLYEVDKDKSMLLYMLFLVSPVDVLLSVITNDITLVLFGSLGTLFLLYALERQERWLRYALLGGVFLAFTFLSKYFAVFLMLSLFIFSFVVYKKSAIKIVLVVSALVLLAVAENLWFNYNSCWNNIIFNFLSRTSITNYNISSVGGYLIIISYLMTPWGLYYLFRHRDEKINKKLSILLVSILSIIFTIFFIVSLKKTIGLHWLLLFIPYMYLLFSTIKYEKLEKLFKYNAIFSFIHIAVFLVVIFTPKSLFINHDKYADILLLDNPKAVCSIVSRYNEDSFFVGDYTTSSYLSYACKQDIHMMFSGSKYGRMDDKLLNIKDLDTKDIFILDRKFFKSNTFVNSCNEFETKMELVDGAKFYVTSCKRFNYDGYKKQYLNIQNETYYNIPSWLPVGKCYFKDRYYSE